MASVQHCCRRCFRMTTAVVATQIAMAAAGASRRRKEKSAISCTCCSSVHTHRAPLPRGVTERTWYPRCSAGVFKKIEFPRSTMSGKSPFSQSGDARRHVDGLRTFPTRCYSNYASSSPSSNSTIALSAASCSVFRCFLRALFSLDFRSRTALRAPATQRVSVKPESCSSSPNSHRVR